MPVMVLLELQTMKGGGDQMVASFKAILPETRVYEGFVDIVVHQNQDDPDNIVVVEKWATKDAYQRYLGWRQDNGTLAPLLAALAQPPSIRYYDITDA